MKVKDYSLILLIASLIMSLGLILPSQEIMLIPDEEQSFVFSSSSRFLVLTTTAPMTLQLSQMVDGQWELQSTYDVPDGDAVEVVLEPREEYLLVMLSPTFAEVTIGFQGLPIAYIIFIIALSTVNLLIFRDRIRTFFE